MDSKWSDTQRCGFIWNSDGYNVHNSEPCTPSQGWLIQQWWQMATKGAGHTLTPMISFFGYHFQRQPKRKTYCTLDCVVENERIWPRPPPALILLCLKVTLCFSLLLAGKVETKWSEYPSAIAFLSDILEVDRNYTSPQCDLWRKNDLYSYAWINWAQTAAGSHFVVPLLCLLSSSNPAAAAVSLNPQQRWNVCLRQHLITQS